jgi:hypothetical protein
MITILEKILSRLFPPKLGAILHYRDVQRSLDFQTRCARHGNGIVYSSIGNIKEYPKVEPTTPKERRLYAIYSDRCQKATKVI